MKKYTLEYDGIELATVEIDEAKAETLIKEMVEFWMGWQDRLAENDGDYAQTWLKDLARFLIRNQRIPNQWMEDEGWYPFTEQHGITVKDHDIWEPDEDLISVVNAE